MPPRQDEVQRGRSIQKRLSERTNVESATPNCRTPQNEISIAVISVRCTYSALDHDGLPDTLMLLVVQRDNVDLVGIQDHAAAFGPLGQGCGSAMVGPRQFGCERACEGNGVGVDSGSVGVHERLQGLL